MHQKEDLKNKTCKDKGGESHPDIVERIKQILNKEDTQ